MSRYEILRAELSELRKRLMTVLAIPTAITIYFVMYFINDTRITKTSFLAGLVSLIVAPPILHHICKAISEGYRDKSTRAALISAEILKLRTKVTAIYDRYRQRSKGELFKKAYELQGRSVREFEEALAIGMYREKREVFVTAFMRSGIVVRVTASIGSPYRCRPSDNPVKWKDYMIKLNCDEIRQYHNHPVHNGATRPSPADCRTTSVLKSLMGPEKKLRSFIICWNDIREWKIFGYDETGKTWTDYEFDASIETTNALVM